MMNESLSDMRTVVGRAALRGAVHGVVVGAVAALLLGMGVLRGGPTAAVDEARPEVTSASVFLPPTR